MASPHKLVGAALLTLVGPPAAAAQGPVIDHKAVGCIVAGQFPRLNACLTPLSQVAGAKLFFRPETVSHWYYVNMVSGTPCHAGVMPKPSGRLVGKKIYYYVEAQDRSFNP